MAIRFLEQHFLDTMDTLYGRSNKTDSRHLGYNQPYIEIKPNDPIIPTLETDMLIEGQGNPIIRPAMDLIRIGKFLVSPRGITFMASQQLQQSGNTFSETRLIDPTWILSNTQPFTHGRRNKSSANDFGFTDYGANTLGTGIIGLANVVESISLSPASDKVVGKAGRLQVETSNKVSGISTKLSLSSLVSQIIGTVVPELNNLNYSGASGILGLNQRPELMLNGGWYSIQEQQSNVPGKSIPNVGSSAFAGNNGQSNSLSNIFSGPLTISNVAQNIVTSAASVITKAIGKFVTNTINDLAGSYNWLRPLIRLIDPRLADQLQNDIFAYKGSFGIFTHRYFIVDGISARRYLRPDGKPDNSTDWTFLKGNGSLLMRSDGSARNQLTDDQDTLNPSLLYRHIRGWAEDPNIQHSPHMAAIDAQRMGWAKAVNTEVTKIISDLRGKRTNVNVLLPGAINGLGYVLTVKNPAPIANTTSVTENTAGYMAGMRGSHNFVDNLNKVRPFISNKDGVITAASNAAESEQDLIDFRIQVLNGKTVRFRSIIERFNTDVKPVFSSVQYIGRIEKNITYSGVERSCNIDFIVHAYSPEELSPIWDKLNYLTSMAFPKKYINGYMVPPLLKLTMGRIFKNQPIYMNALNFSIDENTSWDTLQENQMPMTVMVSVGFTLIEKDAKSIDGQRSFYDYVSQTSLTSLDNLSKTGLATLLLAGGVGSSGLFPANPLTDAQKSIAIIKNGLDSQQQTSTDVAAIASLTGQKDPSQIVTSTTIPSTTDPVVVLPDAFPNTNQ